MWNISFQMGPFLILSEIIFKYLSFVKTKVTRLINFLIRKRLMGVGEGSGQYFTKNGARSGGGEKSQWALTMGGELSKCHPSMPKLSYDKTFQGVFQ